MSTKPRIVVGRRLPDRVEAELRARFEPLFNPDDRVLAPDELVARAHAHQADGLLVTLTDRLPANAIAALPASVRVIATYSVGFNHIDVKAARARGIVVAYCPEATTTATADLAMLLLLSACRRLTAFERELRQGRWGAWTACKDLGTDPGGKVLGIVGMGRIGQAVAARARAFGMTVAYHQRRRLQPETEGNAVFHPTLQGLFRACQMVSLHAPATPETRHLINRQSLSWLPRGAIMVNTARGDLVDDDALVEALSDGRLGAAGLDVFAGEPNFDKRYLDLPNVTLLPHIGTSTTETRERMGADTIANLSAVFDGHPPPWPVP
ncbi:MAG TPA: D-glycerate dehydrogenase [Magnetospirillum sp.]|nr:D-glycerate dehydrogenase [Magnetospirillum sp.]